MALLDVDFPEDFLKEFLSTDFDLIAEEALNETGTILERSMKEACKNSVDHEGDSELANSIKATKPIKTKNGAWIVRVSPTGYSKTKTYYAKNGKGVRTKRKYSVSNALKAIWKEYGIPGHQAAKPFMQKACNEARAMTEKIIQDVYDRRVGTK